ncbi:MAG TPA: DUF2175 family protein [Thermoplasmataceae archaeon]|nr:DUF2175 family protein [Thermoplasmatales archaeon AK]HLH86104.1 DUF2175 family protein [Thermoplasmataceae archaeon]
MAEFNCYVCKGKVLTGEKFTFTKSGAVHFDCFISQRRKELPPEKHESLRVLSILLDMELSHLIGVMNVPNVPETLKETVRVKYKDIEKVCGETTRLISNL